MRFRRRACALCGLVLLVAGSVDARAQDAGRAAPVSAGLDPDAPLDLDADIGVAWPELDPAPETAEPPAAMAGAAASGSDAKRGYTVRLEGLPEAVRADLTARFKAASVLEEGIGQPVNTAQLDRRIREDGELLLSLLKAAGYFGAEVEPGVETATNGPIAILLEVRPGPLFRFDRVEIAGAGAQGGGSAETQAAFGISPRDPVDSFEVKAARDSLASAVAESGFPFARIGEPSIVVDHETETAKLDMAVDLGGKRTIGDIRVTGDRAPFDADHVRRLARFKPGQVYRESDIADLRRAIISTGLVAEAGLQAVPGSQPGTADLSVSLEPAPMRTISGEAGYGTGEGVKAAASWTHRNLIRPEGAVTLSLVAGTREQRLGAALRQSNFRRRDQALTASIRAANELQPAYRARSFDLSAGIARETNFIWQKKWVWSAGAELLATDEREIAGTARNTFVIAALPLTLGYDGSDDLLDPKRGFRLSGRLSPELSLVSGTSAYVRVQLDGSAYVPAGNNLVVAGRARLGAIAGAGRINVAPSRRYYAGGGASLRGFPYQAVGPADAAGNPLGGRSLTEFSLEARVRWRDFGIVPFVDAGNVFDTSLPRFNRFRIGAGLGVRYYSSFGPIRVDLGTPINRRRGEPRLSLFVSLGQAF